MRPRGKLGNSFFGDSGTELNGGAREDMEKDRYAQGQPGNDVDIAQRYAQSEADEFTEHAEQMTRSMEHRGIPLGMPRDEFVEQFAELLRNPNGNAKRAPQPEEQEEPFLRREADDKFWGDPEALKKAGRMVRPPKL